MELRGRWGREREKPALGPLLGTTKAQTETGGNSGRGVQEEEHVGGDI